MADDQGTGGTRRRWVRLIAAIAAVVLLCGGLWLDFRAAVDRPLGLGQTAYFEIAKGDGFSKVARNLAANGLLARPTWFMALAYLEGVNKKLKYGEYEIPPRMTPRELLALFVAGKVRQYPVILVEGWNFREILAALGKHPALAPAAAGKPPDEVMALLGTPGEPPEGRFFPDTYLVPKGTSDLEVLRRAYRQMQSALEREWPNRAPQLPYATPYEALIMASIVEKETARPDERPAIAGVFVRRLLRGMRLQTDPTVIYGLGPQFDGDIRKADLLRDTPFNTYTRPGLPPTPIAMPGLASIRAALHPDGGSALYFVSRGDGTHVFSTTLDEHQRAVNQFQQRRHD